MEGADRSGNKKRSLAVGGLNELHCSLNKRVRAEEDTTTAAVSPTDTTTLSNARE